MFKASILVAVENEDASFTGKIIRTTTVLITYARV